MYQSYRPQYPLESMSNTHIPGLGGHTSPNMPTASSDARMASPEPGEIVESIVTEDRFIVLEAKMEKLEKDNDALRQLVAYLCKGVAKLSDPEASKAGQPKTPKLNPADAFLEKLASDMSAMKVPEVTKELPSEEEMDDAATGAAAEPLSSSTAVQHLSQKQEKLAKQLLSVQKSINTLQISFDNHRKTAYKERGEAINASKYTHKELREVIQVSKETRKEFKDIKQILDTVREDVDAFHRNELHHRVKITVNMRMLKENLQSLWEEMIRLTGITFPRNIEQIADTRRRLKIDMNKANFWASRIYNAALTGPIPSQDYSLNHTRHTFEDFRQKRSVRLPEGEQCPRSQDIEMLKTCIDWVKDTFAILNKLNPEKWEAKARQEQDVRARRVLESRAKRDDQWDSNGEGNVNDNGIGNGNGKALTGVPSGPKRSRDRPEDEADRSFHHGRLDQGPKRRR